MTSRGVWQLRSLLFERIAGALSFAALGDGTWVLSVAALGGDWAGR